jgi:arginase
MILAENGTATGVATSGTVRDMHAVGLIGIPANSAGTRDGVARAPSALRAAGLTEALGRHTDVRDYGDVELPAPSLERDPQTDLIDPHSLVRLVQATRTGVRTIVEDGRFPLVIGGDCPLLLGCLIAARTDGRVGLLFVDGHEDAYLPEQSPTGEAADTELAFALGLADASWSPELSSVLPAVTADNVRLLGARDAETLRRDGVASLADGVRSVDDESVKRDPQVVTERACSSLVRPWWFHLDLDVLSTSALPAIDYPQPGGLGWDALASVSASALRSEPAGWDVTIYNPDLDPDGAHAARIVRFLVDALRSA